MTAGGQAPRTPNGRVDAALRRLRKQLRGQVVLPGDPGYGRARAVWNATADAYPAAVARCAGAGDVVAAVRLAREHDLLVAVRGGGHSYPGFSTCDGGLVIDLSPMAGVVVDPGRRLATAEGGALLGELDRQAQGHRLACPTGHVSHTGVGGLTLGGGVGRLTRRHGLTLDNLVAVELVTAEGERVRVDAGTEPELFWGLRGAGANFGIATSFELRLHPVGPLVLAGIAVYPIERAREVAAAFTAAMAAAPDEVTAGMGWFVAPPGPPFPPAVAGRPVVVVNATHAGPLEEAERDLAPLRALGPALDSFTPRPYLDLQAESDDHYRWGRRNYWKGLLLEDLADGAVDRIGALLAAVPGPDCGVGLLSLGGAFGRVPEDATAFSGRSAALWLITEAVWDDQAEDPARIAWGRDAMAALRPFATSVNYVNDLGQLDQDAVRGAYGPAKYERLVALKRAWDPENLFRRNQNIRP
jgi:FAD/FMN-containing dehydrogenase